MKALSITVLLVTFLLSCGTGEKDAAPAPEAMLADNLAAREINTGRVSEPISERKVIKTGEIRFQTRDIGETSGFIRKIVNELDGYISGENVYNSGDRTTQRIQIRVPAENFDTLIFRISENARNLESRNIDLQDVTEEFIDIEARLKTKKELEKRYMELLSKAKTVEEILSIEKELGTLRGDIESVEGRLKYLGKQVAYSSLNVEFYQVSGSTLNFPSKIGKAFVMGWKWLLTFIIGVVHLWPFVLIITIIVFVSVRLAGKKKTGQG